MKTKRIEMITTYAGPSGVIPAGKTGELPEDEADALIDGGYAKGVNAPIAVSAKPSEKQDKPETVVDPDSKQAMSESKGGLKTPYTKGR